MKNKKYNNSYKYTLVIQYTRKIKKYYENDMGLI